jgi:DNA-binding NarL/FixJ family response regulator
MLLDLHLPDGTGVEVCRRVRAVDPGVRGLLLTAADDDDAALAAILAGAAGYATKLASNVDLVGAVRSVAAGRDLVGGAVREHVAERFLEGVGRLRPALDDDEHRVLELVAAGLTDAEIASELTVDVAVVSQQIADLVLRTTELQTVPPADQRVPGRHRRGG